MLKKSWLFALILFVMAACVPQIPEVTPTPEPEPTLVLSPSPTIDWFPSTPTPTRIATVIGEMAAGILCLLYLRRLQSVQLEKGALRPTWL